MTQLPDTQHAIQFTGPDVIVLNDAKPLGEIGPTELLLKVEACGICFSDTKLLHAFDQHPRKGPVVAVLTPDELAGMAAYRPNLEPTVPGHEPVGRIVAVGDQVSHYQVGERVLVQADWKHLPTAKANAAFGYNFEGALQEYVVIDERCVVTESGEEFLLRVSEEPSAAAIGLVEPWATVEASYAWQQRRGLKPGGRLLVVADPKITVASLTELTAAAMPAEVVTVGTTPDALGVTASTVATLAEVTGRFDDIIYFGSDATVIAQFDALLGTRGLVNVVLGGQHIGARVPIDVGRIHYDFLRYCGTPGSDPAASYQWLPAVSDVRPGDAMVIMGAAGPMGLMHTMRAAVLDNPPASIDATDLSDERLAHLAEVIDPVAAAHQVQMRYLNTGQHGLEPGYTYLVCMVPVPALVAQALDLAGTGAILNAFAGIGIGTFADLDLDHLIEHQVFLMGTSGSDLSDMATVLGKIEAGVIDTTISLDAVTGMAGFTDAIASVMNRTSGGKIMVFPSLSDMGLMTLRDLEQQRPDVAAHLCDGRWTKAAEEALMGR